MPIGIGITKAGMLNVDDYLQIRLLHRDGASVRQIADASAFSCAALS